MGTWPFGQEAGKNACGWRGARANWLTLPFLMRSECFPYRRQGSLKYMAPFGEGWISWTDRVSHPLVRPVYVLYIHFICIQAIPFFCCRGSDSIIWLTTCTPLWYRLINTTPMWSLKASFCATPCSKYQARVQNFKVPVWMNPQLLEPFFKGLKQFARVFYKYKKVALKEECEELIFMKRSSSSIQWSVILKSDIEMITSG